MVNVLARLNVIVNPVSETQLSSYRAVGLHQILSMYTSHVEQLGSFIQNSKLKGHTKIVHEEIHPYLLELL